jgi:hypothetical protein
MLDPVIASLRGFAQLSVNSILKNSLDVIPPGMRLLGMAEAFKAQEQDPSARELSFLERFGLRTWLRPSGSSRRPGGNCQSTLIAPHVQGIIN